MDFLTAEWRKLIIANYLIDKDVLKKYLPYKTELDLWEGDCYVSLVGFLFQNTKVLGIKVPMHINFEEVNLRFYVKYNDNKKWKRGVVFIKELVPRPALSFIANTIYKEHYYTVPMSHSFLNRDRKLEVEYTWKYNTIEQRLKVTASDTLTNIPEKSKMEFITEHYWGYTKINENKTFEYEVTHPRWQAYEVLDHEIIVDFELVYGKDFGFMNALSPASIMLAEGSLITVKNKRRV
jgi:uncharacterized protein YqjF (DUF2071 family)